MRSSKSRSRNKSNRQRSMGNVVNRVFDSSGPEGKVRGTPQQIIDKYLTLARDAQLSNDRVAEQNFLQHAEHYTRMLGEAQREQAREQEARNQQRQQSQGGDGQNNGQNTGQSGGSDNGQSNGQNNDQNSGQNASSNGDQTPNASDSARSDSGRAEPTQTESGRTEQPRADTARSDAPRRRQRAVADEGSAMMPPMPAPDEDASSALVDTPESRAHSETAPVTEKAEKPKRPRAPRKPRQPKSAPVEAAPETSSE
ncbi:DUF4167 domain-containing protein [uncultured Thioclava sp.]|uniref:DUF4167 domain-containing protein n=1 Tax=Thioclava arctica TaxID=3238301 RepID=A0ABV3TN41_9RHOB|nr:DUF4167 domain-containing protein [uncultured Thioclava sp.]